MSFVKYPLVTMLFCTPHYSLRSNLLGHTSLSIYWKDFSFDDFTFILLVFEIAAFEDSFELTPFLQEGHYGHIAISCCLQCRINDLLIDGSITSDVSISPYTIIPLHIRRVCALLFAIVLCNIHIDFISNSIAYYL